jgi:uncharacterized protein YukE
VPDLNIEVHGNPASCRETAGWLGRLANAVHDDGTAVHGARTASETCWQGPAGDAFRSSVGQLGQDADQLNGAIDQTRHALEVFADDLDTVKARMQQARTVASNAGLTVTATMIQMPDSTPGPAPAAPAGPLSPQQSTAFYQAQQAHADAVATYNRQIAAFNEARTTVDNARHLEAEAHAKLTGPTQESNNTAKNLKTIGSTVIGTSLSFVKSTHSAAKELFDDAGKIQGTADRMQELAVDAELTDASRAAAARAAEAAGKGAAATRATAARVERPVAKIPEPLRNAIAKNPGELLEDGSGLLKLGKGALKGLPYVGTGATLASAGVDVAMGKPVGKAAAETGMSLAGGIAGGMAGAELGAAAGSFVPVPFIGTAAGGVVGGVVGGVIGSLSGGKAADQMVDGH